MKAVIIDDVRNNTETLRMMLEEECPFVEILGTANSVASGVESIREHNPNLLFLDIELGDGTGFDLLRHFPKSTFHVIFISAYDKYAIEAFKVNAVDYLLKPLAISDLKTALEKVKAVRSVRKIEELLARLESIDQLEVQKKDMLSVTTSSGYKMLNISSIVRLESEGRYTKIVLKDGKSFISVKGLIEFEEELPASQFFRPHNSHLINIHYIDSFLKATDDIVMSNGDTIPLSRRKKTEFIGIVRK